MYKTKPANECDLPAHHRLTVVALNASLKHEPEISNTEEVIAEVIGNMGTKCETSSEVIRLADCNLPVGLSFRE